MRVFLRHENQGCGQYFCDSEPTDLAVSRIIEFLRRTGGVYCPGYGLYADLSYQVVLDDEDGAYAEIVLHDDEPETPSKAAG